MPSVNPYLYESDEAGIMNHFEVLKLYGHILFARETDTWGKSLTKMKNPGAKVPPQFCSSWTGIFGVLHLDGKS